MLFAAVGMAGDLGFFGVSSRVSVASGVRCNLRLVLCFGTGESTLSCVDARENTAGEMCLIKHKLRDLYIRALCIVYMRGKHDHTHILQHLYDI